MIKIITVYNSLNPGSFLQATSLYEVISRKFGDVCFHDTKSRNIMLSGMAVSAKLIRNGKFSLSLQQLEMAFLYSEKLKQYQIMSEKSYDDIYIIGSDEIWNISRKNMGNFPIFWGIGLNQSRCISYAPSINTAALSDFNNHPDFKDSLQKFHSLSVRDSYSKTVLEEYLNRELEIVCDPVFLIPAEEYKQKYNRKDHRDRYILIYGPERHFSQNDISCIIDYAQKHGLKLISYYFYHEWVDEVVFGDPYTFLELIDNAFCVFTSTFHGTAFSIIYNKQFFVFGENKKVDELLHQFSLDNNKSNSGDIEKIINENIHYSYVNDQIKFFADKSLDYLFENIENIR